MRDVISLDLKEARIVKFFNDLSEFTMSIALGKFNVHIEVEYLGYKDLFTSLAVMLNMMADELAAKAVPNCYMEAALNAIPKAAFLCDEKKRVLFINDKFVKHSGYSLEEIKGKHITTFIRFKVEPRELVTGEKLFLLRKDLSPVGIFLRSQIIEEKNIIERHGTMYTFSLMSH